LSGFQAYNGSNQHVLDSKERERTVNDTNKRISNLLKYFDMSNLIVTGGGTGCFEEETKSKFIMNSSWLICIYGRTLFKFKEE